MVVSSVLALSLVGFAGEAFAGDHDEGDEETVVVPKSTSGEGKVQVIVVHDGEDSEGGRRARRPYRRRKIAAVDGERPPPGYHTETTTMKGLWVGGISMFSSAYLVDILCAGIADAVEGHEGGKYTWYSLIPLAGPFVIAGHDEISPVAKVVPFILLGAIETAGLGMFIGGLASKKEVWISNDAKLDPELYVGVGSLGLRQKF